MGMVIGECPQCGGKVLALDPQEDRVLHKIFGFWLAEHNPECPDYPEMRRVEEL